LQQDRERGIYGIQENGVGRIYIKLLNLAKDSTDAHDLIHYTVPSAPTHKVRLNELRARMNFH
jgi:hypothetical protein